MLRVEMEQKVKIEMMQEKVSSREGEIVDKDDEKKMRKVEPQVPKVVTKSEVGDRDDVNTEFKWG